MLYENICVLYQFVDYLRLIEGNKFNLLPLNINKAKCKYVSIINKFERLTDKVIADLQKQLNRTLKLTEPLEGVQFEYGYNTDATAQVVKYWRETYLAKWSERQKFLNSLPQYTTEIQGLRIHFIHAKPSAEALKTKKVLPVLLLHGWPGSVRE
ncbi:hypothetical protein DOY81_014656, partial [Sarcophaga bullata]